MEGRRPVFGLDYSYGCNDRNNNKKRNNKDDIFQSQKENFKEIYN